MVDPSCASTMFENNSPRTMIIESIIDQFSLSRCSCSSPCVATINLFQSACFHFKIDKSVLQECITSSYIRPKNSDENVTGSIHLNVPPGHVFNKFDPHFSSHVGATHSSLHFFGRMQISPTTTPRRIYEKRFDKKLGYGKNFTKQAISMTILIP
jgi:hypothetical protein